MIRKLNVEDKDNAINFLMEEASLNLFIIGDILNTGFEQEYMELWGEFINDEIIAVLLRYYNNFIPYYKDGRNVSIEQFNKIIASHKKKKLISGKYEIVMNFTESLNDFQGSRKFFCELMDKTKLLKEYDKFNIKKATVEDSERLSVFLESIEEFNNTGEDRDMLENTISTGSGRFYFIEDEDGKIVCTAGTSAETKHAAMIVDVATSPEYRNKGFAANCLSKLCRDTLKDCHGICLFYSNEKAGKIYHKIGFETTGNWMIAAEK